MQQAAAISEATAETYVDTSSETPAELRSDRLLDTVSCVSFCRLDENAFCAWDMHQLEEQGFAGGASFMILLLPQMEVLPLSSGIHHVIELSTSGQRQPCMTGNPFIMKALYYGRTSLDKIAAKLLPG